MQFQERHKFNELKQAMSDVTRQSVVDQAELMVEIAQQLAPIWTGALRSSIDYDLVGSNQWQWQATVYASEPYAIYQEFGTKFMPAHPFLGPAADIVNDRAGGDLVAKVNAAIEDVGWDAERWELDL